LFSKRRWGNASSLFLNAINNFSKACSRKGTGKLDNNYSFTDTNFGKVHPETRIKHNAIAYLNLASIQS